MNNILNLVLEVVHEIGADQESKELMEATEKTRLLGEHLDSMGIVFLVTELESKISDELEVHVALADERAMSQKTSPFRSVKILATYVQSIIEEEQAAK
jgi:acyl carrier protein